MSVYKRGDVWWFHFVYDGRHIQEKTVATKKTVARDMEKARRKELKEAKDPEAVSRKERARTFKSVAETYLEEYRPTHRAVNFAEYAIGHLVGSETLGTKTVAEIGDETVRRYRVERLREKASPKSVN